MSPLNEAISLSGAVWGVLGTSAVLIFAIYRLARYAFEAITSGLNVPEWVVLLVNVILMAWFEGYRGFQGRFSPRLASRAFYLYEHPTPVRVLLAPFFVVGYFQATRATMMIAWIGTLAIVLLVLLVHQLGQPWRGIIDAGVVVGLSWGLITVWVSAIQTFRGAAYRGSPEVPGFTAPVKRPP